ncbi:MAG TPA: hypothetical protein VFB67_12450, partial [Candidatus Polarisedimenticolaceae bacterium]|nr:hypothetical protein [Candidatus Polarisedimenticolaceae bacterium]
MDASRAKRIGFLGVVFALGLSGGSVAEAPERAERSDLARAFEETASDGSVAFIHRGPGYEVQVGVEGVDVRLVGSGFRLVPSGPFFRIEGIEPFTGRSRALGDRGETPKIDVALHAGVRLADAAGESLAEWRATPTGIAASLTPGRWTIEGADRVEIDGRHRARFALASGSVTLAAPGTRMELIGGSTLAIETARPTEVALEIVPHLEERESREGPYVTVDGDGSRYVAGRAADAEGRAVFVTKLAADDATVIWTARFDPGEGFTLDGIHLDGGAIELFGRDASGGLLATLSGDGTAVSIDAVPDLHETPPLPEATATRFGDGSRVRSEAIVPRGGTVVAGTTSRRTLSGATIVQPDAFGESIFIATLPPVSGAPRAAGCPGTINFDNSAGTGAWTTATNWDLDQLPGPTDDVCIGPGFNVALSSGTQSVQSLTTDATATLTLSGSGTLTLASASSIGGAFTMAGGTLNGAADLTIAGLLTWNAGAMGGGATTHANGGIAIGTNSVKDLNPRTLENNGTATWSGAGSIRLGGGSSIVNNGTWSAQSDAQIAVLGGGGAFTNAGTFRKSAGTGTTTIGIGFDSPGPIDVQTGTLSLNGSGTVSGAITGSAGTTLRFNGISAVYTLSSTSSVSIPNVLFDQGTIDVNGTYAPPTGTTVSGSTVHFNPAATLTSVGSNLTISSGIADFNSGEGVTPATMTLSGGTLQGSDTVTISGLLTWSGGAMTGGATTVANGGIVISASTVKDLNPRLLRNAATATWTGTGSIRLGGGATIENNGTWTAQSDAQMVTLSGGGTFKNAGTLQKTAGTGATTITVPLDSTGPVSVQSGTLSFNGGGTASGSITGSPGTTLRFNAISALFTLSSSSTVSVASAAFDGGPVDIDGSYAATTGTSVTAGPVSFHPSSTVTSIGSALSVSGGTATFSSGDTIAPATFNLSGGTVQGTDVVTVSGSMTWTGGALAGGGIVNANGGISVSGSGVKDLNLRTLRNTGTATWSGSGSVRLGGGSVIDNQGTWDAQSDAQFSVLGGSGTIT